MRFGIWDLGSEIMSIHYSAPPSSTTSRALSLSFDILRAYPVMWQQLEGESILTFRFKLPSFHTDHACGMRPSSRVKPLLSSHRCSPNAKSFVGDQCTPSRTARKTGGGVQSRLLPSRWLFASSRTCAAALPIPASCLPSQPAGLHADTGPASSHRFQPPLVDSETCFRK